MASQPQQPYLGMTPPISLAYPNHDDIERTKALERLLEQHGVFESESELNLQMEVLVHLNQLVKQWIKDLSLEKGMPPSVAATVGGHIYSFGSYRMGVHGEGSDINALCVAPRHIQREDFFT